MRKICSKKSDLVTIVRKLKDSFQERGYPKDFFNKETKGHLKVLSPLLGRPKTSERSVSGNDGTGEPLVINNNPIIFRLGHVIRKTLCFLYKDEEVEQILNSAPLKTPLTLIKLGFLRVVLSWGLNLSHPLTPFIFQKEFIEYQYNLI